MILFATPLLLLLLPGLTQATALLTPTQDMKSDRQTASVTDLRHKPHTAFVALFSLGLSVHPHALPPSF